MARKDADLAVGAGDDQHLRLALERRALGGDQSDRERRGSVSHYAAAGSASRALCAASSIVPTM